MLWAYIAQLSSFGSYMTIELSRALFGLISAGRIHSQKGEEAFWDAFWNLFLDLVVLSAQVMAERITVVLLIFLLCSMSVSGLEILMILRTSPMTEIMYTRYNKVGRTSSSRTKTPLGIIISLKKKRTNERTPTGFATPMIAFLHDRPCRPAFYVTSRIRPHVCLPIPACFLDFASFYYRSAISPPAVCLLWSNAWLPQKRRKTCGVWLA